MKKLFKMLAEGYFFMKYGHHISEERIKVLESRERMLEDMILHPEMFKNGEIEIEKSVIRAKEAVRKRELDLFTRAIRNLSSEQIDQLNEH